jgi:protein-tyrosine phosphatase
MSHHTRRAVAELGIVLNEPLRFPVDATEQDFQEAHHVIAVKEAEHRRLMSARFPHWLPKVEFWHVHDLDCCGPEEAIPHLDREIERLLVRLSESAAVDSSAPAA